MTKLRALVASVAVAALAVTGYWLHVPCIAPRTAPTYNLALPPPPTLSASGEQVEIPQWTGFVPPAPVPGVGAIHRVSESDITPPELITKVSPDCSKSLRNVQIQQPVFIYDAVIDQDGNVRNLRLYSRSRSGYPYDTLERCFSEAISQWKYRPARKGGLPVAVSLTVTATVEVQ